MSKLMREFKKKSMHTQKLWEKNFGMDELEPALLDILNFVKANLDKRKELSVCFIDIINDYRNGPLEIVMYSMRELQWQEVKDAAVERKEKSDDPRIWAAMNSVLAVYEDKWEDADFYQYYSQGKDS